MKVHHLYSDKDGVSHFRDIEIDFVNRSSTGGSETSAPVPVKNLISAAMPAKELAPKYD